MDRRKFIKSAGLATAATAATAIAAPAIAQSAPEIKWRLASSFPKSLDTIFGAAEVCVHNVSEAMTDGKFQIRCSPPARSSRACRSLDAVQDGTVECGHTACYYYVGKDPTFAFDTALPFGLNARQQNAWMYYGGGLELMREFFEGYNIINFRPAIPARRWAAGSARRSRPSTDLKGLKMRIGGFAGQVLAKLGVVPQQIAGGDIYPALEKGTIDAAEWVGPYDDEKLGFNKVAQYYYYPGWWEGGPQLSIFVNIDAVGGAAEGLQGALEAAVSRGEHARWSPSTTR